MGQLFTISSTKAITTLTLTGGTIWREYPELRYNINNGITLCHAHHPRKREEEAKLSPFFQQLVAEMK